MADPCSLVGSSVAVAEEEVGHEPRGEREPVGHDPVGEGGEQGVVGGDAGEHEHGGEARLHEAEPARGDRDHAEHRRCAVGEQHDAEPRLDPHRHERRDERHVVEQPVADRGGERPLPAGAQTVHHEVPLVGPARRRWGRPARWRRRRIGLDHRSMRPPSTSQRAVVAHEDEAEQEQHQEQRGAAVGHPVEPVRHGRAEDRQDQRHHGQGEQHAVGDDRGGGERGTGGAPVDPGDRQHPVAGGRTHGGAAGDRLRHRVGHQLRGGGDEPRDLGQRDAW